MRFLYVVLLTSLLVAVSPAQAPANSPETSKIEVVKKEWYMEINNPAFEKSPFSGIEEMQQVSQARRSVRRQNEIRARRGLPPLRTPQNVSQAETETGESPNIYTYKAKFKNNGDKEIHTLIWEYVFYEPGTEREVGRLQFVNKVNLRPGKTKDLTMQSTSPPSNTINVKETGKKLRDQYSDKIIIQSIEYADGSVWDADLESPK